MDPTTPSTPTLPPPHTSPITKNLTLNPPSSPKANPTTSKRPPDKPPSNQVPGSTRAPPPHTPPPTFNPLATPYIPSLLAGNPSQPSPKSIQPHHPSPPHEAPLHQHKPALLTYNLMPRQAASPSSIPDHTPYPDATEPIPESGHAKSPAPPTIAPPDAKSDADFTPPLHRHSPRYPFSTASSTTPVPKIRPDPSPIPQLSIDQILTNPLLGLAVETDSHSASLMRKATPCPCKHRRLSFPTAGRSAYQANRDLRKTLIFDLTNHHDRPAFTSFLQPKVTPRADDLEALMFSYPGLHLLDYDNPPACPHNDIDTIEWLRLHALHCRNSPPCTSVKSASSCYFKPLHFMLSCGYQAVLEPGHSWSDIRPHSPAYIQLWNKDSERCARAFDKLLNSTLLQPIDSPLLVFPLLPAYRGKHLWRHMTFGTDYDLRLTSDISSSGGNDIFASWRLRYLGLHALCQILSRGDYLATRDITGFYNRLPAGETLRRFQCFQDPRTYAASTADNNAKVNSGRARFLQQLSCMFGHKQLPAWASCVSSELARILHHQCIPVAGVLIDDFLFQGPASLGPHHLQAQLDEADALMTRLNMPPNNKGQAPSTKVVFSGISIDTIKGIFDVDDDQRLYVLQRLRALALKQSCPTKELASINGSLGWLCFVIHQGRCRRDLFQQAAMRTENTTDISKPLRKLIWWWIDVLANRKYKPSPIWFRNENQPSVLIQSDASGDSGFGFCVAGIHVTGCWPPSLASTIEGDMFVKELLPITIAVLLTARLLRNHIFGIACDNSGVVSRINCGSCRSPIGRRLLMAMVDTLTDADSHVLADWNNREQPLAVHADLLSKIFTPSYWASLPTAHQRPWVFNLVLHDLKSDRCICTTIRLPRLAEALPVRLRH